LSEASEDLAYLRNNARQPSPLGTIQGVGQRVEETIDGDFSAELPFEGAVVLAQSKDRRYETRTGRDGSYRMRVPAGRYRIDVQVPDGWYVPTWTREGTFVDVLDTRGCAAADFTVLADGRISGRVVDARGDPIAGLMVEPVLLLGDPLGLADDSVLTNEQGTYELTRLRPGRYMIVIGHEFEYAPQERRVLYPGVTDASAATEVELGSSERLQLMDVMLPASIRIVPVTGTVRDQSGSPITGVGVYLRYADQDAIAVGLAITDSMGKFRLSIPAGRYVIVAEIRERTSMRVRSQESPPFDASATLASFEITLPD